MTAALNAANERANEIFRQEKIGYLDIAPVVRQGVVEDAIVCLVLWYSW